MIILGDSLMYKKVFTHIRTYEPIKYSKSKLE